MPLPSDKNLKKGRKFEGVTEEKEKEEKREKKGRKEDGRTKGNRSKKEGNYPYFLTWLI